MHAGEREFYACKVKQTQILDMYHMTVIYNELCIMMPNDEHKSVN